MVLSDLCIRRPVLATVINLVVVLLGGNDICSRDCAAPGVCGSPLFSDQEWREAIGLGCYPLLPRRQVYPEMVGGREAHLYDTEEQLAAKLEHLVSQPPPRTAEDLISQVGALAPSRVAARWDEWLDGRT